MQKENKIEIHEKLIALGLDKVLSTNISNKVQEYLQQYSQEECWKKMQSEFLSTKSGLSFKFAVHEFLYKTIYPDWLKIPRPAWFPSDEIINNTNIKNVMRQKDYLNLKGYHRWSVSHYRDFWHMVVQQLKIQFDKPYTSVIGFQRKKENNKAQKSERIEKPEKSEKSEKIEKSENPEKTEMSDKSEFDSPQWFVDGLLNIAKSCFKENSSWDSFETSFENSLENPVEKSERIAIITQTEFGVINQITYSELDNNSNLIALGITKLFKKGDRIAIIMPLTKDAIAIYLAIIKAGCVVVSIAESFSAEEIAKRLTIANAKAVFTRFEIHREGKILPLYKKIVDGNGPKTIVMGTEPENHLREEDINFNEFLIHCSQSIEQQRKPFTAPTFEQSIIEAEHSENEIIFDAVSCQPDDYINILFSSGTSGDPKAIPWTQTTPIKCASDAFWHHDLKPGNIFCWPTSLGWMMGPWLIFATLINQCTIAIYEGSPNDRKFGKFVQDVGVTHLGVVPTLVKNWRKSECMEGLDWRKIKLFTSTGECSHIIDMLYLIYLADYRPIIEYCGGTEIGGAYITGTILEPCAPGAFTTAAMGIDFVILDDDGKLTDSGEVALIGPSIGLSTELLNKDHFEIYYADMPMLYSNIDLLEHQLGIAMEMEKEITKNIYFAERKLSDKLTSTGILLRRHGDHVVRFSNGFYRLMGRMDDTMNLSGIKVGSAEVERVLNIHPKIKSTAAIGLNPKEGGPSKLVIFAETPGEVNLDNLKQELQGLLNDHLNPLFKIHQVIKVDALPRTESNKIMRRLLRDNLNPIL